tara:strand:- start:2337 stop:2999 length:663 start_codon:yes stop_codon:yes gene_type:complete
MPAAADYINDIEETLNKEGCGAWDTAFLKSIMKLLLKKSPLSPRQVKVLDRILYSHTNEVSREKRKKWKESYRDKYKKDAHAVAWYHTHQPYYALMAQDILAGHVPDEKAFFRMFNNKYSQKVLAQYRAIPKFTTGDLVAIKGTCKLSDLTLEDGRQPLSAMLVSSHKPTPYSKLRRLGGIIVAVDDKIFSAANGSRRYKVLPVGDTEIFYLSERFLILR